MSLIGDWSYPTTVRFGAGRIQELGDACTSVGINKPLLVTDKILANLPITEKVLGLLEKAGLGRSLFAEVNPNPTDTNLEAGIYTFKKSGHDGIVALGGGSALDVGKLIAFMANQTSPVWDFEDVGDNWTRANAALIPPIVAVPTTAGTGSEVGRAAVIINSKDQVKKIIFHPKVLPSIVICDPELTVGMPPDITVGTGMDAFTHCLEAFSSPFYHPMSQGIALEGMRLVTQHLPRVVQDANNIESRAHMMSAAAMGAVAFQKGLGAVHAISHPVGVLYNTHHGMTNAVVIPPVLELNRRAIEGSISKAAAYLGIKGGFDGFYNFVVEFRRTLGVPDKLRELGVGRDHVEQMTEMALADPSGHGNPIPLNRDNVMGLFEACI
jgi:alcohol dehydrogenase